LRFKDVFSIIGPMMVGPSSSHTAGAVRLGRVARQLLGSIPQTAEITLYGSFAETYQGHGTDVAIIAGLLHFDTDDLRIPEAMNIARTAGMSFEFKKGKGTALHPNTARIEVSSEGRHTVVEGASIGGGNIEVTRLDGFDVKFGGMSPTIVLYHRDAPGVIAAVSDLLWRASINISHMVVDRKARSGEAIAVIETDGKVGETLVARLAALSFVRKVKKIDLTEGGLR
jgi:L-serine dehydratase